MLMRTVAIGVGSNMGSSMTHVRRAMERVGTELNLQEFQESALYGSAPLGPVAQSDFVNAVCVGKSDLAPEVLLDHLLRIEEEMGRERRVRWGPRVIDLDLLFVGESVLEGQRLHLPHPEMHRRVFVLKPLCELGVDWLNPVLGLTLKESLQVLERGPGNQGERLWLLDPEARGF